MTKTSLTTAAMIAALAAPTFADTQSVEERLALDEDSAAERIVPDLEDIDSEEAKLLLRKQLDEKKAAVLAPEDNGTTEEDLTSAENKFSQSEDSAAEIND